MMRPYQKLACSSKDLYSSCYERLHTPKDEKGL